MTTPKFWWQASLTSQLLQPLSWLYRRLDRLNYRCTHVDDPQVSVPVVVVGNILVGGTGKSLLIQWLASQLTSQGLRVGIIARGYRGKATGAMLVSEDSDVALVGDEPLMLKQRLPQVSISVAKKRDQAAKLIESQVDVILSDDGMQHYGLWRDLDIAVIDGRLGVGNGKLLPSGPLREPAKRLTTVDYIISKGASQAISPDAVMTVTDLDIIPLSCSVELTSDWANQRLAAIAGIGQPQSFFDSLAEQGLKPTVYPFADHHDYRQSDLEAISSDWILTTAKDAVKLKRFNDPRVLVCYPKISVSSSQLLDHIVSLCHTTS